MVPLSMTFRVTQYRRVTDGRRDGHRTTSKTALIAHSVTRVKIKRRDIRRRPFSAGSQSLVSDGELHVWLSAAGRAGFSGGDRHRADTLQLLWLMTYTTGWRRWRAGHCPTNWPTAATTDLYTAPIARPLSNVQSTQSANSSSDEQNFLIKSAADLYKHNDQYLKFPLFVTCTGNIEKHWSSVYKKGK